jgi:hypothetical protein
VNRLISCLDEIFTRATRHDESSILTNRIDVNDSNVLTNEPHRARSKTISTVATPEIEYLTHHLSHESTSTSTGLQFLQSIKDLTHQELYRANPLGLLGKEIISVTGTTYCPEPIPPNDAPIRFVTDTSTPSPSSLSPIDENEPQQVQFSRDHNDEICSIQRSTPIVTVLPPCPGEFLSSDHDRPCLFSSPSPETLIADFIPDTMTINVFEVFIYAWGVLAFFVDMITDLVLAHAYYIEGAYWLFLLTLMCVVVPNLTLSIFSLVWYIDSSQLKATAASQGQTSTQNESSMNETKFSDDQYEKDRIDTHHPTDHDVRQRNQHQHGNVESTLLHQQRTSIDPTNEHVVRSRTSTLESNPVKTKHLQLSAATVNVLTWTIRIVILVLQLDLCLK